LIAVVIGSAVMPTLIANAYYLPHHLLEKSREAIKEKPEPKSQVALSEEGD